MVYEATFDGHTREVTFNEAYTRVTVNGHSYEIIWTVQENGRRLLRIGNRLFKIDNVEMDGRQVIFTLNGSRQQVEIKNEQDLLLEKLGFRTNEISSAGKVSAPMPGKIVEILIAENEEIEQGQPVIILEAMKMENELKSPSAGRVSVIHTRTGDSVEKNQPLLEIEAIG